MLAYSVSHKYLYPETMPKAVTKVTELADYTQAFDKYKDLAQKALEILDICQGFETVSIIYNQTKKEIKSITITGNHEN